MKRIALFLLLLLLLPVSVLAQPIPPRGVATVGAPVVDDRIVVYYGISGRLLEDGGMTIAELLVAASTGGVVSVWEAANTNTIEGMYGYTNAWHSGTNNAGLSNSIVAIIITSTNGLASTNWVNIQIATAGIAETNDAVNNATNLAEIAATAADTIVSNAALAYADALVENLAGATLFGVTNIHPVIGGWSLGMVLPEVVWTSSAALAVGTNELGTWFFTNVVDVYVPADNYVGHYHANFSGVGNPDVSGYFELVVSDGSVTNLIGTSELMVLDTAIEPEDAHVHVATNHYYSSSWYMGVRYWAIRSGGASATINMYGGTIDWDSHISTPTLSPSAVYLRADQTNAVLATAAATAATKDVALSNAAAIKSGYNVFTTSNKFDGNVKIEGNFEGGTNTTASGDQSHAEGVSTIASGDYSHAEGYDTSASSNASHSEGVETEASADGAHAEGGGTLASGQYSHAEGINTVASGTSSHAEGSSTTASGDHSHAGGEQAVAAANLSFCWSDDTPQTNNTAKSWLLYASGGFSFWGGNVNIGGNKVVSNAVGVAPTDLPTMAQLNLSNEAAASAAAQGSTNYTDLAYGGSELVSRAITNTTETINEIFDGIGKYIHEGATVTVVLTNGVYTPTNIISLAFYGNGSLVIQSTGTVTAAHTTQPVLIDASGLAGHVFDMTYNRAQVTIKNIAVIVSSGKAAFRSRRSSGAADVLYNYIYQDGDQTGWGVYCINGGFMYAKNNTFANLAYAFSATTGGRVNDWGNAGTNNTTAYYVDGGVLQCSAAGGLEGATNVSKGGLFVGLAGAILP